MIVSVARISKLSRNLRKQGKKIIVVGGCFDVLHPGHVIFLEKAKKEGDILLVLLESDEKVKKLKGIKRPVHNQKERAKVLLALKFVDFVVMLPFMDNEKTYDELILKIRPDIIATAYGYEHSNHHERSARLSGAKIKYVTKIIGNHSTSRILNENLR